MSVYLLFGFKSAVNRGKYLEDNLPKGKIETLTVEDYGFLKNYYGQENVEIKLIDGEVYLIFKKGDKEIRYKKDPKTGIFYLQE